MRISDYLHRHKRSKIMKVFLVDDHEMILDGIESLINKQSGYSVVGRSTTMNDAIQFLSQNQVDLLITDFNLPDGDGLSLVRRTKKSHTDIKIIMVSMYDEKHLVKEILKEGIDAYILKKDSQTELLNAIQAVEAGKKYMSNEINEMLINSLNQPSDEKLLTDREREVLKLIAQEYTNKNIAESLFISERTVETHRKNIFRKTKTSSLVGLIKFAYANNLI